METAEYLFDLDDQQIFSAKNSDLKAKVLRYHLMPRLNKLLKVAMQQAQAIFEVDLMEHSTISQSPGFRTDRRKGEITMDYDWCKIGLTGVRKPIWSKIHNRKTGEYSEKCVNYLLLLMMLFGFQRGGLGETHNLLIGV